MQQWLLLANHFTDLVKQACQQPNYKDKLPTKLKNIEVKTVKENFPQN